MTLVDSLQSDDRREALVALRGKIAQTIDKSESARDIAALSKRYMELTAEIESLPDPKADADPVEAARRKRQG